MTGSDTRKQVYTYVARHPGSHLRQIQRRLNLSLGTLRHHLEALEGAGLLDSRKDRYFRRFFISGEIDHRLQSYVGPLRQTRLQRVAVALLSNGPLRYGELVRELDLPNSTLSLYLGTLVDAGIVERKREGTSTRYAIRNEEEIRNVLHLLRRGLSDELVDRALEIFEESSRR